MKFGYFFLIAAIVACYSAGSTARAETRLTFCYDPYPPYTFGYEGAPNGGLKVVLLAEVMALIDGLSADIVLLPWKRCQAQARAGEVDGILPLFESPERANYLTFSDGTFEESSYFWYRKERFADGLTFQGDFSDISHLRLGMLNGGHINSAMEEAFSANQEIVRARDVPTLMQLLLQDRVDLIATDGAVGRFNLERHGWTDRIVQSTHPITSRKSRFGLSRATGADRHLDAINRAIAMLNASGRIDQILNGTQFDSPK